MSTVSENDSPKSVLAQGGVVHPQTWIQGGLVHPWIWAILSSSSNWYHITSISKLSEKWLPEMVAWDDNCEKEEKLFIQSKLCIWQVLPFLTTSIDTLICLFTIAFSIGACYLKKKKLFIELFPISQGHGCGISGL